MDFGANSKQDDAKPCSLTGHLCASTLQCIIMQKYVKIRYIHPLLCPLLDMILYTYY